MFPSCVFRDDPILGPEINNGEVMGGPGRLALAFAKISSRWPADGRRGHRIHQCHQRRQANVLPMHETSRIWGSASHRGNGAYCVRTAFSWVVFKARGTPNVSRPYPTISPADVNTPLGRESFLTMGLRPVANASLHPASRRDRRVSAGNDRALRGQRGRSGLQDYMRETARAEDEGRGKNPRLYRTPTHPSHPRTIADPPRLRARRGKPVRVLLHGALR